MNIGSLSLALLGCLCLQLIPAQAASPAANSAATPLFATDGAPAGWQVRNWMDVAQDPSPGTQWLVKDGVLRGSTPRGSWLVSDREYGDFKLEYEFKLGDRGCGGFGFRFPATGHPAHEGLFLQMVDPRYYGTNYQAQPAELTGALYKGLAPQAQAFKPNEWNACTVVCMGSKLNVVLNGTTVIDIDLIALSGPMFRGKPIAYRPRRGHLGFQETSRGDAHLEIRNARIQSLDPVP